MLDVLERLHAKGEKYITEKQNSLASNQPVIQIHVFL